MLAYREDDDSDSARRRLNRSRSRRASSNVDRQERSEAYVGPSYESVRSSSRQASPSYEFHSEDDSSVFGSPASSIGRVSSVSGPELAYRRRASSADKDRLANYESWGRPSRARERFDEPAAGPSIQQGFSRSFKYQRQPDPERRRSEFLSPSDFERFERRRPRPKSADYGTYETSYLRPHRSTESFGEENTRPREILEIDDHIRSNSLAFDELARTCRDKGGLGSGRETDLTFSKIAGTADNGQYRLNQWSLAVQLTEAKRIASDDGGTLRVMHDNFDALYDLTRDLSQLCRRAKADDLIERRDDFDAYIEYLIARSPNPPPPPPKPENHGNPLSLLIREKLTAIESRLQNIELLADPIKETLESNLQPSLRRKVVQDAERFFGSEAQLRKYPITPGLTGEAALREAQATYVMSEKPTSQHKPVSYVKAHQAHLDTETLDYYKLRWEKDKKNPEYIVILEDSTNIQPQVLFEHTRRLRARRKSEIDPETRYAFVRKKEHSRSRSSELPTRFKLEKE